MNNNELQTSALNTTIGEYVILRQIHSMGSCTWDDLKSELGSYFNEGSFDKLLKKKILVESKLEPGYYYILATNEGNDLIVRIRAILGINKL